MAENKQEGFWYSKQEPWFPTPCAAACRPSAAETLAQKSDCAAAIRARGAQGESNG